MASITPNILLTKSSEETKSAAAEWASQLAPHEDAATVCLLQGDLGAGKTTFVQGVAEVLGVKTEINSPTFVIEKIYPLSEKGVKYRRLIHIDCYRLEKESELGLLNLPALLADPGNLLMIEWADKFPAVWPAEALSLYFSFISDEVREIRYGRP